MKWTDIRLFFISSITFSNSHSGFIKNPRFYRDFIEMLNFTGPTAGAEFS
jgi:hypothetical protein